MRLKASIAKPESIRTGWSRMRTAKIDPNYFRIDNLPHIAECFFEYLTDPYLVGLAQEIVGTHVRLLQSDAHIIRYPPEKMKRQHYGFHGGWHAEFGRTTNGPVPLSVHQKRSPI